MADILRHQFLVFPHDRSRGIAAVLQTISAIVQRADPTHSEESIARSPLMQIICCYDDFRETIHVSRGIMEAHHLTLDHWDAGGSKLFGRQTMNA